MKFLQNCTLLGGFQLLLFDASVLTSHYPLCWICCETNKTLLFERHLNWDVHSEYSWNEHLHKQVRPFFLIISSEGSQKHWLSSLERSRWRYTWNLNANRNACCMITSISSFIICLLSWLLQNTGYWTICSSPLGWNWIMHPSGGHRQGNWDPIKQFHYLKCPLLSDLVMLFTFCPEEPPKTVSRVSRCSACWSSRIRCILCPSCAIAWF